MSIELGPDEVVQIYGESNVVVGEGDGQTLTLNQALEFERMMCPADESKREDPKRRVEVMVGMLARGGSLLPEHEHLLGSQGTI